MVDITYGGIKIRTLAKEDSKMLLKWLTDPRVLEYYEGRDKKFTEELIDREFFQEDNDTAVKVCGSF